MADCFKALIPDIPAPKDLYEPFSPSVPTIVGHYWLDHVRPGLLDGLVTCIDYGAGHNGPLTAYRWDRGDRGLHADRFVQVE